PSSLSHSSWLRSVFRTRPTLASTTDLWMLFARSSRPRDPSHYTMAWRPLSGATLCGTADTSDAFRESRTPSPRL
ncbi:hypothetical protein BGZ52_000430, partial [Haplosporangium bisporale]